MLTRTSRRLALATLTLAAVVASSITATRAASACSPACEQRVMTFENQALPANVRALPVPYTNNDPVLTLGGVVVPATLKTLEDSTRILVPGAPLADGAYAITYDQRCSDKDQATATFTVGATIAEPQATGTLRIATQFVKGVKRNEGDAIGGCGGGAPTDDHMIAQVSFDPDPSLGSYASLTTFSAELSASATPWKRSFSALKAGTAVTTFRVSCEGTAEWGSMAPGIYTLSVSGQVAGADGRLPTSTASMDLTCPASIGGAGDPSTTAPSSAPASAGGCSVGGGNASSQGHGLAFGIGAAALALVAVRRRARRTA